MNEKIFPFDIFGTYTHVGLVVKDIDAYCAKLEKAFGYKADKFGQTPPDDSRMYYGEKEPFVCKMAFFYLKDTMLELLCPIEGKSVWQDHIDAYGEGLHHLNFDVTEYDKAIAHLDSLGMKVVQSGLQSRRPGFRWCYVDAREELGFYIEIAEVE